MIRITPNTTYVFLLSFLPSFLPSFIHSFIHSIYSLIQLSHFYFSDCHWLVDSFIRSLKTQSSKSQFKQRRDKQQQNTNLGHRWRGNWRGPNSQLYSCRRMLTTTRCGNAGFWQWNSHSGVQLTANHQSVRVEHVLTSMCITAERLTGVEVACYRRVTDTQSLAAPIQTSSESITARRHPPPPPQLASVNAITILPSRR